MIYCQECSSEITNVDSFCPFCGISLQSQIVSDESKNNDLDSEFKLDESDDIIESDDIEMTSDDLIDKSDEESDMSETIVVNQSEIEKSQESSEKAESITDSGYLDIKNLKSDENESKTEDDSEIASEVSSSDEVDNQGDKKELETNDDLSEVELESDVKDSQDLVQDENEMSSSDTEANQEPHGDETLAEDEDSDEDSSEEADLLTDAPDSIDGSNEKPKPDAVEDIDGKQDTADVEMEVGSASSSDDSDNSKSEAEEVVATAPNVSENEKVSKSTPTELQTAEDNEIEEAVSVLDSKALVWKENEESKIADDNAVSDNQNTESKLNQAEKETAVGLNKLSSSDDELDSQMESEQDIEASKDNIEDGNDVSEEVLDVPKPKILESQESSMELFEKPKVSESLEKDKVQSEDDNLDTETSEEVKGSGGIEESKSVSSDDLDKSKEVEKVYPQTTPNIGGSDTDGSKSNKLKPLDEGVVLNNRYEIVRKIGGGGMGAVYLANDKNLGGVLRAVKEMVQSYIEEEQQEKAIQDFKRESMILTRLDHPTIPTIYDYFYDEAEARFYLVMKYISGGDLSARLKAAPEGKLDEILVTQWALQITDVLDYLHSKNPPIVYRDLKPANIMIDGNSDKIMLIDFGIARSINKEEKGVTAVGTMGYAPPELFSGKVEPSSDIYSLGSTMFHLLTGADPQSNPLLIFDFQKHPRPRQINPQLSDQMERILMRAVEYNSDRRFSSAAELRNALKDHLGNLENGRVSFGIKESPTAVALSDQPVFCGFCGQKIVATDMFCAFCGAKQPLAQPGIQSKAYSGSQTTAKLIIDGTSELDYHPFELIKDENLLGRRDPMSNIFPEVDLSKYDPQTKISRKHARIWRDGEDFMLEDLGSSNGTTFISSMNDRMKLMPNQTQILHNGDKIQVGDTTLQFMVE